MGKKSSSSSLPPEFGEAMKKQAELAEYQQKWFEEEMYPWLKEQTNIANENAALDREWNKENAEFWQQYAQTNTDRANAIADEYRERQEEYFQPIEDKLIAEAKRYNDGVEAERQAGYAIGDVASSFASQRRANAMRAQAYGVNPTSGAYQSQQRALDLQQASLSAAAANQARNAAQQLGWQKNMQVAALGDKYLGAAQNMYQIGNQTAQTGGGLSQNAANQSSTLGQIPLQNWNNYANIGLNSYQSLQNAWSNIGNQALQGWQAQKNVEQANASSSGALGGAIIGTVGTVAASF